jgi:hypothetical protein
MAKVTQVVLMGAHSYRDNRYVFQRNVPVTMRDENDIKKYQGNGLFAVRVIEDAKADLDVGGQTRTAGDPFKNPVSEESVRLPARRKKTAKKLKPKQGE